MMTPQVQMIDETRMRLVHGPCDLIIEAFGSRREMAAAYMRAIKRFDTILEELCTELPQLRKPAPEAVVVNGTARRMLLAVLPYSNSFITPMAAVAGAVADEILEAMTGVGQLDRAYVNNGGDIALWLAPGETFSAAIGRVEKFSATAGGRISIRHGDGAGGIATSGWRGRSFSRGIADAVSVVAGNAASADAAATMIANAVRLDGSPKVATKPAWQLAPDSDLGGLAVTVAVDKLSEDEKARALDGAMQLAEDLLGAGLIRGAALCLQGQTRLINRNCFQIRETTGRAAKHA